MFADYRVPQVLAHEKVLVYADALKQRLEHKEQIPFGDVDEIEIRAASILAVQLLVNELNERIASNGDERQRVTAAMVDVVLWRRRREQQELYQCTPFHRTRSIFY
jgi:hypothetical protein